MPLADVPQTERLSAAQTEAQWWLSTLNRAPNDRRNCHTLHLHTLHLHILHLHTLLYPAPPPLTCTWLSIAASWLGGRPVKLSLSR